MRFTLAKYIMILISAKYPGGILQYREDGGSLAMLPLPREDVIAFHPSFPAELKKSLEAKIEEIGIQVTPHLIITETRNFPKLDMEQQALQYRDLIKKIKDLTEEITFLCKTYAFGVLFAKHSLDSPYAKQAVDILKNTKDLYLGYVGAIDGTLIIQNKKSLSSPIVKLEQGMDHVVSADDINNLKILLAAGTIEDLLKL